MMRGCARLLAPVVVVTTLALCASPPPAQALDVTKSICTLAGLVSGLAGKVCSAARHAGTVLKAGQKLLSGRLGAAAETLSGARSTTKAITAAVAVTAIAAWVIGGARLALHETAAVIPTTTRPQLQSTWFSSSYWRMAGIATLLTLPFLFAAAIQALLRSDLSLLARSALGYLPLSALAVAIAAPLAQLLLTASDELSNLVSSASGYSTAGFVHLTFGGVGLGIISSFPVFFVGLLAVAAAVTLWIELLIRSAAVYVIVLMLPLFFAALVWPARRVWAVRAIELLIALILSKFAIVAVLALGAAALGHTVIPSVAQMLAGTTLVLLAAFTPWALLRLLPLHELAASVEGMRGAGARGLAPADEAAANAFDRTEASRRELAEARGEHPRSDAGQASGARSAVEGLNAGGVTAGDGAETEAGPPKTDAAAGEPAPPAPDEPTPTPDRSAAETVGSARTDRSAPPSAEPLAVTELFSETAPPSEDANVGPGTNQPWERGNLTWRLDLGPDTPLETSPHPRVEPDDDADPR
jgi:hypothetical protein